MWPRGGTKASFSVEQRERECPSGAHSRAAASAWRRGTRTT